MKSRGVDGDSVTSNVPTSERMIGERSEGAPDVEKTPEPPEERRRGQGRHGVDPYELVR